MTIPKTENRKPKTGPLDDLDRAILNESSRIFLLIPGRMPKWGEG